ncbi:unnamed protein product, partial [Soboliphyme baturini]|uniref:C2 domain-containing protein n=1 Tax=Soboliphyme baturini TaxID=241478 RepID=A0A183I962_9BILA
MNSPSPNTLSSSNDEEGDVAPTECIAALIKCPDADKKEELVEETWSLLNDVTFVRIVINKLTWERSPRFAVKETQRRVIMPDCNSLKCEFHFQRYHSLCIHKSYTNEHNCVKEEKHMCLKFSLPDCNQGSYRNFRKIIRVLSKEFLPSGVYFNHRTVILINMKPKLLVTWSESVLVFDVLYQQPEKPETLIAKCSMPLYKLLVMPFSVEANLPLYNIHETATFSGSLQVCMQLGSRFASFTQRVEAFRNPSNMTSPFSIVDPLAADLRATPAAPSNSRPRKERQQQRISQPSGFHNIMPYAEHHEPSNPRKPLFVPCLRTEQRLSRYIGRNNHTINKPGNDTFDFMTCEETTEDSDQSSSKAGNGKITEVMPLGRSATSTPYVGEKDNWPAAESNRATENIQINIAADQKKNVKTMSVAQRLLKAQLSRSDETTAVTGKSDEAIVRISVYGARFMSRVLPHDLLSQRDLLPTTYLTCRRNDQILASPVVHNSPEPVFNWDVDFPMSLKQKNVVFKLWQVVRDAIDDRLIGLIVVDITEDEKFGFHQY